MRKTMAYVPSSDVPSAFLISSDADAVLLDLLGTFILLDGGPDKVLFTKHVRQIDANIISAPTKAALTNAVELNKNAVVPLVGNIPTVKSGGSEGSVASLLKRIEQASGGRPGITPTRFSPKYEPIMISKSLRTGRLELIVLAGESKEVEALQKAVESGDEQTIEKVASNNGTISVLVWFPAKQSDPIKRILHTGTAPLARVINALERAKSLPFLHTPIVSAANAYKDVPAPAKNHRPVMSIRNVAPTIPKPNPTNTKTTATRRSFAPANSHPPPSRTGVSTTNKSAVSNAKPASSARPSGTPNSNRARTAPSSATVKNSTPSTKVAPSPTTKKPVSHEPPIQKTNVTPVKGAAMSRAVAAVGKAAEGVTGKKSGTIPSKSVPSKSNHSAAAHGPAPEVIKEPAPTPVEPMPPLDDVVIHDDVPDICVDAPQDPASSDERSPVELVVIPPTPEPRSQSGRSSFDGPQSPAASSKSDNHDNHQDTSAGQQHVLPSDDEARATSDLPSPGAADTPHENESSGTDEKHELFSVVDGDHDHGHGSKNESDHSMVDGTEEDSPKPPVPTAPPLISEPHDSDKNDDQNIASSPEPKPSPHPEDTSKNEIDTASRSSTPHEGDSAHVPSPHGDIIPAEPFSPPLLDREGDVSKEVHLTGDVPEEFKGPHVPEPVGENGLLDGLEEPPKLMKISMDTDDLKKALEKGASAVADELAHCLDALSMNTSSTDENHSSDSHPTPDDKTEVARKISQQMIDEASTPFTSALASALTDGAEAAMKAAGTAYDELVDLASTVSETVVDGVKDAAEQMQEKMKAMQTRSSLVDQDGNAPAKYDQTDPVIDSVLETVASDSDRVDHSMSNGGVKLENKENKNKPPYEVDEDGFRMAADSHDMRLYLPPLSAARATKAAAIPHLSRPLYFELTSVPHLNGKCTLTDEQSAVEYFTNVRSANYILHSEDISTAVLDGWLAGKKHWLRDDLKSRLIPTRHHSALVAFVTAHNAEMEEHGLSINSSLEHNTISLNTEEGREDYHMMKIEL